MWTSVMKLRKAGPNEDLNAGLFNKVTNKTDNIELEEKRNKARGSQRQPLHIQQLTVTSETQGYKYTGLK